MKKSKKNNKSKEKIIKSINNNIRSSVRKLKSSRWLLLIFTILSITIEPLLIAEPLAILLNRWLKVFEDIRHLSKNNAISLSVGDEPELWIKQPDLLKALS